MYRPKRLVTLPKFEKKTRTSRNSKIAPKLDTSEQVALRQQLETNASLVQKLEEAEKRAPERQQEILDFARFLENNDRIITNLERQLEQTNAHLKSVCFQLKHYQNKPRLLEPADVKKPESKDDRITLDIVDKFLRILKEKEPHWAHPYRKWDIYMHDPKRSLLEDRYKRATEIVEATSTWNRRVNLTFDFGTNPPLARLFVEDRFDTTRSR